MEEKSDKRSPFVAVSESLHRIDVLFNSKREDLVKRLREGNSAWEQRKKQHPELESDQGTAEPGSALLAKPQTKQRRNVPRDDDYPQGVPVSNLLQQAEDNRREKEVRIRKPN